MTRITTAIVTLCAALAILIAASSGPAQADLGNFNPSCGQNTGKYAHAASLTHTTGEFTMVTEYNCAVGGSWLSELQYSSDNGLHWIDLIEVGFTTSSSQANQNKQHTDHINNFGCNSTIDYRMKTWEYGDSTTKPLSGGC
jgi:hypothetical protein